MDRVGRLLLSFVVAASYVVAGKLGLLLAFVHPSATAVWAPTGIALAAYVRLGYGVWPAIFVAAFVVNVTTAGSLATSLGIALGNTLEGALGYALLRRFAPEAASFARPADVFAFTGLAALAGTTVSATIGVASLALGGYANWSDIGAIWATWWLGDVAGALIVAPPLLLWTAGLPMGWGRTRWLEAGILSLVIVAVGSIVFGGWLPAPVQRLEFLGIPSLVWVAFRFGQREAVTATLAMSAIALWGTMRGAGPFAGAAAHVALLSLQTYMSVITLTALLLAAAAADRRRAQLALGERLRFEALLSELSATFVALPGARIDDEIEKSLQLIVEELSVDAAGLAEGDWRSDVAQITHSWTRLATAPAPLVVRVNRFPWIGARLLEGHVVTFGSPEDLPDEAAADRQHLIDIGVRSMVAMPLTVGGEIVGALWFTTQRAARDWPEEIVQRLRLLGEVFANALARRHAENAVRESEARFRSMADTAPVLIWMSGPDKLGTFFNKGWLDFTGRRMEQELGSGWLAGVHPDDADEYLAKYVDAFEARREVSVEYRLRRYDGEYRWVLDQGVPRFAADGEFLGYIGCASDVTQRKQAEERPRQVLEAAPNAMIMVTDEGTITLVNAAVEALFGYARDELIGCPIEVLIPERFRAHHLADRKSYVADPRVIAGRELLGRRKDGREVSIEVGVTPITTSDGMFVLASIVDISARKQAESEVQRLRRDLAHVGRVATMGELTASLAHELNQPLTAILTNARAAQMLLSSGRATAQELAEILADIASDDKRAGEVIHRLRTLLTKGESERTPLDLSEVTREVMRLVRTDALIRNVSLKMDLADGLPLVAGDRVQLQQVILNLIFNGLEAMRDSTVGDRHLLVTTRRTEVGVLVSIHDRGPGIQEADLSRVFEPFYTTKATGMGIGLSIARSIVEAHGGSLWAENHAAGGAAFSFAIPVDVSPPG